MAIETPDKLSLARYVPRVSAEWGLRTSELWREIDGTLCYIDISGFTALSEKLARRGRIGAEELTEVLNHVFGNMLSVAYDRGGSLLKFGGDALLLMFTGSHHATQAASAAVEMQGVLREARSYETSAGRLSLKMSVGLHSGTVHLFRVGESHKELILTGPAASMTTEMEETAVAGEILISSATRAAASANGLKPKEHGWLLNWRKGRIECCGWSPRASLAPEAIAEGMPVALRSFLSHGAAEPEHHIATVGFIKFTGVDALMDDGGPDAVAAALDELVRTVQQAADEEGVTFLASDIDEDGGKIILVAGVPSVQEDDEGRMLRAARRIIDAAGTLPVRIGINQGHVFVGEIGTDFRATYTIMGDTVNLAARLMAAASPGQIYASPTALDKSLTLFETTPLEPFHVKGKEHPVQAYAVGAETGSRPSRTGGDLPFAGRSDELAAVRRLIDDLFAGKGAAVAVVGERGIGKSRFVDEILPALQEAEHVDIRAEPYGIGTPYRALRDPVRRLLNIDRGAPPAMAQALQDALARVAPEHAPLAPLVADVAMIEMAATPEVEQIDPRFRQDRTADLLIELIEALHPGPVFFEVEDGHYMDEASSHIMERISQATAGHPWLVLTTRRNTPDGFDPGMEQVSLGPLSDAESRQLVIAATEGAPLRPHDIDVIVQRGGGLPLFLEEIIGAVRKAGGVDSLPDSLDAVVSAQIDALPPLARRLLRFSSVLGRSFRISVLNRLLENEGIRLDAATRRELSGLLDSDGRDRLRFRHALIRDVAYRGLSFKRRRDLHLQAGEIAEQAAGDHPEGAADVLALHFSLGQDYERAWRYSLMAADQARDAYANVDAAAHYQRALEAARRLPDVTDRGRADAWIALGDVRERAGLFDEALTAYRKATKLIGTDPVDRAALSEKRARVRERAGQYGLALREITSGYRATKAVDTGEAARVRSRLLAFAASVRQGQQKPLLAIKAALDAVDEATAAGEKAALARAYSVLDLCYRWSGQPDKAVFAPKALAIYEELGNLDGQGIVHGNMGIEAYFDGRWDDAIDHYRKSRDAFRKTGNEIHAANAEANMGEVLVNQGRI
ncbi:MAG: AAA family ATPase, partial [Acidimicrobiia bacterium]|nr:AAA family ATPase [Acidimicrobiia bacterium]